MNKHFQSETINSVSRDLLALNEPAKRRYFFRGKRKRNALTGERLSKTLLNKLSLVSTHQQGLNLLSKEFNKAGGPFIVSFINAHCFNLSHQNPSFCSAILKSDLAVRDGKGIEILCKSAGVNPGVNMCGSDTIPKMLHLFKDSSLALLGTEMPYLSRAAEVLRDKGNKVVLVKNGFQSTDDYVNWIEEIQPKVILLGMGMPKQELLSALLKSRLTYKCLIINGGAIIDHLGEKMSRAPMWMRKRGLEWLYRLMQEPGRLFMRYVIGNIIFIVRTYKAAGRVEI